MSPYLKLLAAPGHLLQLVLQVREPFADLVQDIVQLAIVGVGLVEVCFVFLSLVQSDYAGVSPARQNIINPFSLLSPELGRIKTGTKNGAQRKKNLFTIHVICP